MNQVTVQQALRNAAQLLLQSADFIDNLQQRVAELEKPPEKSKPKKEK